MNQMEKAMEKQTKHIQMGLQIKEVHADEKVGKFTGLGSVFGVRDQGGDVVVKGAFVDSLKERMPVMLWQHDANQPIGVFVKAVETDEGLQLDGEINLEVERGREAFALLKQGAIKGLSIGYFVEDFEDEKGVRFLKKLSLWEVSVVTFPMNQMANVTDVKSVETIRDFERMLICNGFSRQEAKTIASGGYNALSRDDEEQVAEGQRDADIEAALKDIRELIGSLG